MNKFREKLINENLSQNTIDNYLCSYKLFIEKYKIVNKKNLLAYKGFLIENYKPKTINLRINYL